MPKTICVVGAFDTKESEYEYVINIFVESKFSVLTVNTGVMESSGKFKIDVDSKELAAAGGGDIEALRRNRDRGEAMKVMSKGASVIVRNLYEQGRIDGIFGMGGTGGTSLVTSAMRTLPLGIPKICVSTVASGDTSAYVGTKDIVLIPSIVDVSGLNKISRMIISKAAGAICGMMKRECRGAEKEKPIIVASMFGNTTPCVEHAKVILEKQGYEVLVFHCTGTGGRTMESLVEAGFAVGVLDITTTEWADELVGGVFTAGPTRLDAAAKSGVPAIVVPGCLDMVNFNAPETVPVKFKGRRFYQHNPNVTLMRTNVEESRRLGEILAEKLNMSKGPVTVLIPLRGISMIDLEGKAFHWPEANKALFSVLKNNLKKDIRVIEMDCDINAPEFSDSCADTLLEMMSAVSGGK